MTNLISTEEANALKGNWNYQSLPANVQVGTGCFLEREGSFKRFRSKLEQGLVLGNGVRVYTWTEFNIEPTGSVEVGDDTILVGAVFMCAEKVTIGKRVVVSYNVTIADSDFHPVDPEARKRDAIVNAPFGNRMSRPAIEAKPVVIEDDVQIGIGAMVLKGVRVGRGAIIAPGSIVTRNVDAWTKVAGNPARLTEAMEPCE
jgi:acetyltransferase-like isoleucine patch superfamily enzyme